MGLFCNCGEYIEVLKSIEARVTRLEGMQSKVNMDDAPIIEDFKHRSPEYFGYEGGYADLTECSCCKSLGLYEDQHPVNPCRLCGSKVNKGIVGRWENKTKRWVLK